MRNALRPGFISRTKRIISCRPDYKILDLQKKDYRLVERPAFLDIVRPLPLKVQLSHDFSNFLRNFEQIPNSKYLENRSNIFAHFFSKSNVFQNAEINCFEKFWLFRNQKPFCNF